MKTIRFLSSKREKWPSSMKFGKWYRMHHGRKSGIFNVLIKLLNTVLYSCRTVILVSFLGFVGGIWTLFPVFGLYNPPDFKCKSPFQLYCEYVHHEEPKCERILADDTTSINFYEELFKIESGKCEMASISLSSMRSCVNDACDPSNCGFAQMNEELFVCFEKEMDGKEVECTEITKNWNFDSIFQFYNFDFAADESFNNETEYSSAVTDFNLVCGLNWVPPLITSMAPGNCPFAM